MTATPDPMVYPVLKWNLMTHFQNLPHTNRDYQTLKDLVNSTSLEEVRAKVSAADDPFIAELVALLYDWSVFHVKHIVHTPFHPPPAIKIPRR